MKKFVSFIRALPAFAEDIRAIRIAVERTANANRQAAKSGARDHR